MENSAIGTILGLVPFVIVIIIFVLYLYCRSMERKITNELAEFRSNIRNYQRESSRLKKESSAFSPNDPEPYGPMAEDFNAQMVEFEKSIDGLYQIYSQLHQQVNFLRLVPFWKLWYLPLQWYRLDQRVEILWLNMEELKLKYQSTLLSSEKINHLGIELTKQSKDVVGKLQDALLIYHELSSKIKGNTFTQVGKQIKEWEDTLKTQIPMSFLASEVGSDRITQDKDSITQVHRVLKTTVPEVNKLYEKLRKWQSDLSFISSSLQELKTKHELVEKLVSNLENRTVSPIQWEETRTALDSIESTLGQLNSDRELISVDELRGILHSVKHLMAKHTELDAYCLKCQADYLELLQLWSSMELQKGNDWIKNVGQILEQTKLYSEANWKSLDDLGDFRMRYAELSKMQFRLVPRDPSKAIPEKELTGLVEDSRLLYDLHLSLRSRLEKISGRLKEIQKLHGELKEKLSSAKSVLTRTEPVLASNPFLKKVSGNGLVKMQTSLDQLIHEIDESQQGMIEVKAQKTSEWMSKAEQSLDKWLGMLSDDLDEHIQTLDGKFHTLGNFNNLEDIVITEVREILKKAEQSDNAPPLSRPGELPILVIARNLWAKNELWQKVVSAGKALEDIAGPVLERYQKAEKSRQTALKLLEKGDTLVPDEPGWPPTTQYLHNERKQAQSLENSWQALQWEHIQAINLVGRLSDLSEQYQGLSIQLQQVIEKAEQEHKKIVEYERRFDESKGMWLNVVSKFPEYKSLKDDVDKLFLEIDRDYENLKKRSMHGGLPFNQVLQNMRSILRKIDDAMMPAAGNQVVDINGELQKRLY